MKKWLGWLLASFILVVVASYAWMHRPGAALAVATGTPSPETEQSYDEDKQPQHTVTVAGPLANYVQRQTESGEEVVTLQPTAPAPVSRQPSPLDQVGASPVGTSTLLLHKTFSVKNAVDLPFEIPAHAATPQLRGIYRSFVQQGGTLASDSRADVEFLVMNEKQFADFIAGRPGDALFSADDAHEGEVNARMPPTLDRPTKYNLLFRNGSAGKGKKVVQADFRIDY
jgi:hypothetical protein